MNLENNEEFQELTDEQKEVVRMLLDGNGYSDITSAMMACDDVESFGKHTKYEYSIICLSRQAEHDDSVKSLLPYIDYEKYAQDILMDFTEYNDKLYLIP